MAELPSPQKVVTDITAFSAAAGALMEAMRDNNEEGTLATALAQGTALGAFATAAAVLGADIGAFAEDSDFGVFAKLAGLATAQANLSTLINDLQAIIDHPEDPNIWVKEVDAFLSLVNLGVSITQFFADMTGNEEIGLLAGSLSALITVAQWAVNGRFGELFDGLGELLASPAEAATPQMGGSAVIGSFHTVNGQQVVPDVVIVASPKITLNNSAGVLFAASAQDGDASGIFLYSNAHTLVNFLTVNREYVSENPAVVITATAYTDTFSFDDHTVIVVSASRADGTISATINGQPLAGLAPGAVLNYTPVNGSTPATLVIAYDGQQIGQKYTLAANGTPGTAVSVSAAGTSRLSQSVGFQVDWKSAGPKLGSIIGSKLGNLLANGNKVEGIIYGSLLGTLGKDLAAALVGNHDAANALPLASSQAFDSFLHQVGDQIVSGGVGLISNMLFMELGQDLGLSNFGTQLLSTVGSSVVGTMTNNVLTGGLANIWHGFNPQQIFNSASAPGGAGAGTAAVSAIASFLCASLGKLIVSPQTQAAGFLSSLGSAIGSWAFTTTSLEVVGGGAVQALGVSLFGNSWMAVNVIAPGVGALIGFVLGALIGNLFGHKKPKIPTAGASTVLNLPYAQYKLGTVSSSNGGSTDLVVQMASNAAAILNGVITQVTGGGTTPHFVANGASPTQTYGYTGSQVYVTYGGTQHNVSSPEDAVSQGVLWALPQTQIIGGDLFMKRAITNVAAPDLNTLAGNLQTAKDYERYEADRDLINSYIQGAYNTLSPDDQNFYDSNKDLVDTVDMSGVSALTSAQLSIYNTGTNAQRIAGIVAALKNQSVANPWIITLLGADELKLGQWTVSDFYGGASGFLQSFGVGSAGCSAHFEDIHLSWDSVGGALTLSDGAASGKGLFSLLNQATADGSAVTVSGFATAMGYATPSTWGVTSGNTLEAASGTGAISLNNAGHNGYNIFIGGDHNNTITAGNNDTWIQGGAGTDILTGGNGHDVIIAGSGNTTIYGGNASGYANDAAGSYLAAGSGTTHITGGSKNDTILLGSGTDTVAGGAGDDLFILAAATTGTRNGSIDGGTGSNTLSFERFAAGVSVNLGAWSSPSGTSYTLTNIQNLVGAAIGGNRLTTGGSGGILEGGGGLDVFTGVAGGTTTVSFANSGSGVDVDLSYVKADGTSGLSMGGSSNGDVFNNIKNLIGSNFSDLFTGIAGSTLDGGVGGDDIFNYSGGGNTYKGSASGNNTLDYSLAPAAVTINLTNDLTPTGGTGQVTGYAQDKIFNITRILGSSHGSTVTGLPYMTQSYDSSGNLVSSSASNLGIYFVAEGGTNTLTLGGYDTVELNPMAGQTYVTGANQTITYGAYRSYNDVTISQVLTWARTIGHVGGTEYMNYYNIAFGIAGTTDSVTYNNAVINTSDSYTPPNGGTTTNTQYSTYQLSSLNMDNASVLDISHINYYSTQNANGSTGFGGEGTFLITNGTSTSIDMMSYGTTTSYGGIVIAGKAGTGTINIATSAGDDQIAYERGDGHYTVSDMGGQKTIDFGPSVASNDVIYNVVGSDLYIGLKDGANPNLTADQVSDNIRIYGGAVQSIINGVPTLNNPFFLQVAGSTIDVSKLNLPWVLNLTNGTSATLSNQTFSVAASATVTVTGDSDTANVGSGAHLTMIGTNETVNMTTGTVSFTKTGTVDTVNGASNSITMSGAGDYLTVLGSGNTATISSGTVNFAASSASLTVVGAGNAINAIGASQTVTVSGNGANGTSNTVSFTFAGTFNLAANSRADVNAGNNTLTVTVGNTANLGSSFKNSTITAGTGDGIWLGGTGNTVTATSSSIYMVAANLTETVGGTGNSVILQATGEHLTVTGNNTTITGSNSTITITGTSLTETINTVGNTITASNGTHLTLTGDSTYGTYNYLTMSSGFLNLSANSNVMVTGSNNTLTLGNNDFINLVSGSNTTVNAGTNENLWTSATGGVFTASSSSFNVNVANATESLSGTGNTVTIYQTGDTITTSGATITINVNSGSLAVVGSGDTINVQGTSQTVTAGGNGKTGTADTVNMQHTGDILNVSANSNVSMGGDSNTINLGGTDNVALSTNNSTVTASGTGNVIGIGGTGNTVNASSATINWSGTSSTLAVSGNSNTIGIGGAGSTLNLTGTGNSVALSGSTINVKTASSTTTVTGSGATVNMQAASQTVSVGGNGTTGTVDVVNLQQGASTLNVVANSNVSMGGNGDTINLAGADNVNLSTSNSIINASGTGNVIGIGGTGNTVNGSSTVINWSGAGSSITLYGNSNTLNLGGSGASITIHGSGEILNVSNSTIYEGNTSTATINGTGNTIVHLGTAPIILDLDGLGIELTPVTQSDVVTTASNGVLTRLGWVGPTNGILVTDRNGDGQYGDVNDISFIGDKADAQSDLEGLAGWDSNGDGVISALDAGWSKLKVWVDANMDGASSAGEVKSLDDLGISSISLKRTLTGQDGSMTSDSYVSATTSYYRADGTAGTAYDVTLGQALLDADTWDRQYGTTASQLSGGQLGHLTGDGNVSYDAAIAADPALQAVWDRVLDQRRHPENNYNSVTDTPADPVSNPNRGAHAPAQRMQVLDLDLSGKGPTLIDAAGSTVMQDIGRTGNAQRIAWVGAADSLLVIDTAGDGAIDAPTEATFQALVPHARTSLQGLVTLDSNADQKLDAGDDAFARLRLWTDSNGDGVSQAGELKTLSDLGVKSISLAAKTSAPDNKSLAENQILTTSTVTFVDGSTRTLYDIALGIDDPNSASGSDSSSTPAAASPIPVAPPLPVARDLSLRPLAGTPVQADLDTPLDATTAHVGRANASYGPLGQVMTADGLRAPSLTDNWWLDDGESLFKAIERFSNPEVPDNTVHAPVSTVRDAAAIQRQLLLRQSIAGFTTQDAGPAVFNRQGGLDTMDTLARATQRLSARADSGVTPAAA